MKDPVRPADPLLSADTAPLPPLTRTSAATLSDWDAFLDHIWQLDIRDKNSVRDALDAGQTRIAEAFRHNEASTRLVRARCELVDTVLMHAWRERVASDSACLVAVGGYGRNELLPRSDIDLLVLYRDGCLQSIQAEIESFFAYLWDIGLEIGHSVRSPIECKRHAAEDVTIMTNLMESRILVGNPALFAHMRALTSTGHIWSSADYFNAKIEEQKERHARFDETPYKLEPNVKASPGGLRDIQTIAWVAMRRFAVRTLDSLVDYGFLDHREFTELHRGRAFLWRVRFALHLLTGRNENRLLFDHQIRAARMLGYQDAEDTLAVERFMQDYYRNIKALSALNDILLQLFSEAILHEGESEPPKPINARFQTRHGFIEVTHDRVFVESPVSLLEIFHWLQIHPELGGIRAHTLRLMRRDRHLIDENFSNSIECKKMFIKILQHDHGVTRTLRRMNRYGILGRYLPNFGRITGRMQYDLFHTLTVDEHTLFVIRNLRRLATPAFDNEMPFASHLMQNVEKPYLLYIAALMHDIAKGRGGNHSELGAQDARTFCVAHGLAPEETDLVCWLVRQHLLMSMTAQRRDISNVSVINEFAREAGTQTRLSCLYLLTICDIRATNPKLWNSWKDSLLTDLYNNTQRALARGLDDPLDRDELIAETRSAAAAMLTRNGVKAADFKAVWGRFEPEYFLRHSPDEITRQTSIVVAHDNDGPLVSMNNIPGHGTIVFVYSRTHSHLFSVTTGVMTRLGLSVLDARISTTNDNYTLDTYAVAEDDGTPVASAYRQQEVEAALVEALKTPGIETISVNRRQGRRNQYFDVPTRINFINASERDRTVMEIFTADRPGLLSTIGEVFHRFGILIRTARIATIGERVEDAFFITDLENNPIRDDDTLESLRDAMTKALASETS